MNDQTIIATITMATMAAAELRSLNRKLRAEIRSLRRKLEDANRGAENNAHALYHCSQRGKEDAEKAHKLKRALTNLLPFVITRQHLLTEPVEFYLAVEHARDVMKEITQN